MLEVVVDHALPHHLHQHQHQCLKIGIMNHVPALMHTADLNTHFKLLQEAVQDVYLMVVKFILSMVLEDILEILIIRYLMVLRFLVEDVHKIKIKKQINGNLLFNYNTY